MENKAVSSHIVVLNQNSVKPPESKANNAPDGGSNADFANLLAAQINGERPSSEAATQPHPGVALLEDQDKKTAETAAAGLAGLVENDPKALINNTNILSIGQIQSQKLELGKGGSSVKNEALALDLDVNGKTDTGKGQLGLDKAAIEVDVAAKFAASDKTLPLEAVRDFKVDFNNPSTLAPGSLSQLNRAAPIQTATPIATAQTTVAVPVGQTGWDAAFSQRVAWIATNTQQIAHLHLNPPNLGPLEIRISLSSDQANAAFNSPHAAVRDAIEAALPRLREMLADNGLSLGNVNVSSQSFQQQQQAQSGQSEQQRHDPFRELQRIAASTSHAAINAQGIVHISAGNNGLVDIFA